MDEHFEWAAPQGAGRIPDSGAPRGRRANEGSNALSRTRPLKMLIGSDCQVTRDE